MGNFKHNLPIGNIYGLFQLSMDFFPIVSKYALEQEMAWYSTTDEDFLSRWAS